MGLRRVSHGVTIRCVVVLILGFAVFLSALFWVLPFRSRNPGFDAKDSVKLSATVQASFKLEKPVSELIPRIGRLEYDIYGEIGAPATKVAVLSMHQAGSSNYTNVVFGVLSDPVNIPINTVSLIMLKSSFVELYVQLLNLTLTTSIFGQTSDFQILKFPGGVSVIPKQSASFWQIPQILFKFSLNNSVSEIQENSIEFREQLKDGLHLKSYENIYVQVTNTEGSTLSSPVIVQASVVSDLGSMLPERLKELAQVIIGSPSVNLGLDNSVFGKVKSVTLSSFLKDIEENPSSPSPAPSPGPSYQLDPQVSPSYPPAPVPRYRRRPPCFNCKISAPCPEKEHHRSFPPMSSRPPPFFPAAHPPSAPPISRPALSPAFPPHTFAPPPSSGWKKGNAENLVSPFLAPSSSSSSVALRSSYREIWLFGLSAVLIHLFAS